MLKSLGFLTLGLILGFSIGETDTDEIIKEKFDIYFDKAKESGKDVTEILFNILNNIEGIDTDEIKINIEKLIELTKEKINELVDIEDISNKIRDKAIEVDDKIKHMKTIEIEIN